MGPMDEKHEKEHAKEHASRPPEKEFLARTTEAIDKALQGIVECEERMALNKRKALGSR